MIASANAAIETTIGQVDLCNLWFKNHTSGSPMLSQITSSSLPESPTIIPAKSSGRLVTLVHGQSVNIENLDLKELIDLQCEQEPLFARAIAASPKDSLGRAEVIRTAYATICSILDEQSKRNQSLGVFSMGMDTRYADLVMRVLKEQERKGIEGGLFELGCSAGALLGLADRAGYRVGGLEVVPELLERTRQQISPQNHRNLYLGDFRQVDFSAAFGSYSVAYWNDVFEHIPTDEIEEYLLGLYSLLKPGGVLITITPNWHMRPSDVTMNFRPPRSEAEGFHLKEYTLREVHGLLRRVGFANVAVPCWISRKKIHLNPLLNLTRTKCLLEPLLERLPYKVAVQMCRRFGLSCTIAVKPHRV